MALIACPACGHRVSEAAASCPSCGHPIATAPSPREATFKDALTRPAAVQSGFTVLGIFVAAPWIARVLVFLAAIALAAFVIWQKG